jgi:hypothetical protein
MSDVRVWLLHLSNRIIQDFKSDKLLFQFLKTMTTKCSVFWDITPLSPVKINVLVCFGGTYQLHFQDCNAAVSCLVYFSTFKLKSISTRRYIPDHKTPNK